MEIEIKEIAECIETLCIQLQRHCKEGLKEYPTRTIFIDPLLAALGWDIRDPDEVELEHLTVDGKSVDYAMKVNRKVVLHVEAKQLGDSLDDVKSITQVVGYAANDGIEWCVLTNGLGRALGTRLWSSGALKGVVGGCSVRQRRIRLPWRV